MHHVSRTQAYTKMAFGQKSKSTEELNTETAYPKPTGMIAMGESTSSSSQRPNSSSDKSSVSSSMDLSLIERSELAVDQLVTSRKQLEDEIGVITSRPSQKVVCYCCGVLQYLVEELTKYGEDMNCRDECAQVLQDR